MTDYRIFLFIHVLSAIIWVGGATMAQILITRQLKRNDPGALAALGKEIGEIGDRVFTPISIVLLLSGIYMVVDADLGFTTGWVAYGLGGIIVTIALGAGYLGPQGKKVGVLVAERGPGAPEVGEAIERVVLVSRIDLAVLLSVVFVMTYKPF